MEGYLIAAVSGGSIAFFLLGVPVFLVIGFWVVGVSLAADLTLANVSVTLFEGINFFSLLAVPLFILTGDLINAAGIARRLTDFAYAALGWLRGGLGLATIGASGMFAAISGSNAATTATIGSVMYPEMRDGGYDERFAAATIASGGCVGIIIPPSVIFIVYGFVMNLPIGDLFIAGVLPGLVMVAAMMVVCLVTSHRRGWGNVTRFHLVGAARAGGRAYLGFVAIFVVMFGIYTGIFSPTEAAAIVVGFSLVAGVLVTRELRLRSLPNILMRSGQITGLLVPLIAVSVIMQQLLTMIGAAQVIGDLIGTVDGYYLTLTLCLTMVLVAGCFIESMPVTIILAPIVAPAAIAAGADPVHFAVVFVMGAAIGFITPPFGLNLFVASGITGIPYLRMMRFILPYFAALMTAWGIVVAMPWLSLGLLPYMGR